MAGGAWTTPIWARVLVSVQRNVAYLQLWQGQKVTLIRTVRTAGVHERTMRLVAEINRRVMRNQQRRRPLARNPVT